jgi:hypothetical protein
MERKLRIRIDRIIPIDNSPKEITIPNGYIFDWVKDNKLTFPNKIHGFRTKVVLSNFNILTKLGINQSDINFLFDYSNIVHVEIEINTNYKNKESETSALLPQHGIILSALRSLYKKYDDVVEIVRVTDHKDKSVKILMTPNKKSVGTPYKLYINNQLITEKFYPYDIFNYEQLEENVFLNLSAGTHYIKLESPSNNLKINGFACGDLIMTNISVNELSFQIQ